MQDVERTGTPGTARFKRLAPIVSVCGAVLFWFAALASVTASTPSGPPAPPEKPAGVGNIPQSQPAVTKSPAQVPASKAKPSSAAAKYVGDDTCTVCHGAQAEGYAKTPHHIATDRRTPAAAKGCETCHGPGSEHAEDPAAVSMVDYKRLKAADANKTCVTCHDKGQHALWDNSPHESRGLACISCHSIHAAKSDKGQLKAKTQMELCATCHRDKVSKLDRSGHMPIREGKMQCSTCHNVHGSTTPKLLAKGDSTAELCTSCHAEKRGPYLWEHAPVRDGCVTCHDPHGSSNERMLVVKTPMLCQRCHVGTRHPSTIYDAALVGTSVRVYARSCVICHAAIHGSNHPSGQFFIR
jgi:DmsE family decaheme c-type cytochrome